MLDIPRFEPRIFLVAIHDANHYPTDFLFNLIDSTMGTGPFQVLTFLCKVQNGGPVKKLKIEKREILKEGPID